MRVNTNMMSISFLFIITPSIAALIYTDIYLEYFRPIYAKIVLSNLNIKLVKKSTSANKENAALNINGSTINW